MEGYGLQADGSCCQELHVYVYGILECLLRESVFYKADIVEVLKNDYLKTLKDCKERTLDNINNGWFYNFIDSILRLAAPLM